MTVRYWPPTDVISLSLYAAGLLQMSFFPVVSASHTLHFSNPIRYWPPTAAINLPHCMLLASYRGYFSLTMFYWLPTNIISLTQLASYRCHYSPSGLLQTTLVLDVIGLCQTCVITSPLIASV